jgi:hypothetical protein
MSSPNRCDLSLIIHAENLHCDPVWKRVKRLAHWVIKSDGKLTFFVYSGRARAVGKDIRERVRCLGGSGHEIAQHTHFYVGYTVDGPQKVTELSEVNVRECLSKDFRVLDSIGLPPKGFTAGAWALNECVLRSISELGVQYDCSARWGRTVLETRRPPNELWMHEPGSYQSGTQRVLLLPTTCSIGDWYRWGWLSQAAQSLGYQSVYLHDYDLLKPRVLVATWLFVSRYRQRLTSMSRVAESFDSRC